ncbi:MAG: hypothetical protein ACLTSX_10380 [Collinsella sp.]
MTDGWPSRTQERKEALAARSRAGAQGALKRAGVRMAGNAFSPGRACQRRAQRCRAAGRSELLSGADGTALRAALGAIGWEPQDLCVLAAVAGSGDEAVAGGLTAGEPLPVDLFRRGARGARSRGGHPVWTMWPPIFCARPMPTPSRSSETSIPPCSSLGSLRRFLAAVCSALDGFEAALSQPAEKQRMWAYLKQMPPLGAPY